MRRARTASIRGILYKDTKTKKLIQRLATGSIVLIDHEDLDQLAAESLVQCRVVAVINARPFVSGRYPTPGPAILLRAGIPLFEAADPGLWHRVEEGAPVVIDSCGVLFTPGGRAGMVKELTQEQLEERLRRARQNLDREIDRFVSNTLNYAWREKHLLVGSIPVPDLQTSLSGKHALVVVRGPGYREDLRAVGLYIRDFKPVLIGVDGGADALLEMGLVPDIVIGDMDSVSDNALRRCREIVVHAFPGGAAPGLARVSRLGLSASLFPVTGTSEDAALLLAYEKGARLIVAVGTHTNLIDFLEKGRAGMASTMLVRLKVGPKLVDAKGVSMLYRKVTFGRYVAHLVTAALFVITATLIVMPLTRGLLRLTWLGLRLRLGF